MSDIGKKLDEFIELEIRELWMDESDPILQISNAFIPHPKPNLLEGHLSPIVVIKQQYPDIDYKIYKIISGYDTYKLAKSINTIKQTIFLKRSISNHEELLIRFKYALSKPSMNLIELYRLKKLYDRFFPETTPGMYMKIARKKGLKTLVKKDQIIADSKTIEDQAMITESKTIDQKPIITVSEMIDKLPMIEKSEIIEKKNLVSKIQGTPILTYAQFTSIIRGTSTSTLYSKVRIGEAIHNDEFDKKTMALFRKGKIKESHLLKILTERKKKPQYKVGLTIPESEKRQCQNCSNASNYAPCPYCFEQILICRKKSGVSVLKKANSKLCKEFQKKGK